MTSRYPIPIARFLTCPNCGRDAWHNSTIYIDHEANLCQVCNKEWIVKFGQSGVEYDRYVKANRDRATNLVYDLITKIRAHKWSKRLGDKDTAMVQEIIKSLLFINDILSKFVMDAADSVEPAEIEPEPKTVSNRGTDHAWEFRRTRNGRIFEGVIFAKDAVSAKGIADLVGYEYHIPVYSFRVFASQEYPERYIISVPRDALSELEHLQIESAKRYLRSIG